MPGADYQVERHELRVERSGDDAAVYFQDSHWWLTGSDLSTFASVQARLRELPVMAARLAPVTTVIEVTGLDGELRALPWESLLVDSRVIRRGPVPPRVLDQPLTLPIRVLQLDLAAGRSTFNAFDIGRFGLAVEIDRESLDDLEDFQMNHGWPGVDILHVTGAGETVGRLAERGDDPSSTRLGSPVGSLGWLERLCAQARVRLLTLEGEGAERLALLRGQAGQLVDRGGPVVLVDGTAHEGGGEVVSFYRRVLHDRPFDLALGESTAAGLTLTVGRNATELLRPSAVEAGLRALVEELRTEDSAVAEFLSGTRDAPQVEVVLDSEHGIGWFAEHDLGFDQESRGMVPMASRLDDFRRLTGLGPGRPAEHRLWRAQEAEAEPRYLNVELDAGPLVAGRRYPLSVDIGPRDPVTTPLGALALLEEVFAWEPGQAGSWAEVGVTSLGLRVIGEAVQQVWVPRTGASQRLHFTVVPDEAGVCAARICLYVNQNIVQSAKIAARCAASADEPLAPIADLARSLGLTDDALGDVAWAARVEYALHALGTTTPSRTLSLVVNDNQGVAVTTVKGTDVFGVYTAAGLEDVVEEVRTTLEDVAGPLNNTGQRPLYAFGTTADLNKGSAEWFAKSVQALAEVGWKLYFEVFKNDRKKLQDLLREVDGRISVAHVLLDKVIPWAVAYDREFAPGLLEDRGGRKLEVGTCLAGMPDATGSFPEQGCGVHPNCLLHKASFAPHTVACPRHFWGFRHQIELPPQQSVDGAAPASAPAQVRAGQMPTMTVGMHGGLRFVDQHVDQLQHSTRESGRPPKLEEPQFGRIRVIHDLKRTDQDIVYLYCHAEGGYGTNIPEPAFRVRRRMAIGDVAEPPEEDPIQAVHIAGDPWPHNPLIVLNGCRTAAFRPNALSKFIAEFVYNRGAGGVLATEIAVFEELAGEIGTRFVRDFLDGKSAGQSLMVIRRDLLRRSNPLGLAYTLYATMDFHLGGEGPGTRQATSTEISAGGGAQTTPERELVTVGW